MVGIVVVSHSDAVARGIVELARQMGGEDLALEPAGGLEQQGVLGTDPQRIQAAIERAMSTDGVLVLMDLGSALMSAELAIEMLGEAPGPVVMSEAPLVEGAVAAAVAARGGATVQEVAAEARGALAMKASQLGIPKPDAGGDHAKPDAGAAPADAEASIPVRNAIGLHARPAARLVETARRFDAEVRVAKAPHGKPVRATSLTNVVALGARLGDTLRVSAAGPEAQEAVDALKALADEGFGDGVAAGDVTGVAPNAPDRAPAGGAAARPAAPQIVAAPEPGTVLHGVPASPGLAAGPVAHLGGTFEAPAQRVADTPEREHERLQQAIEAAHTEIEQDREQVAARAGKAEAEIFGAHLALLDDEALLEPAGTAIDRGASAERAFYDATQSVAERYRSFDQPLLAERAADVLDVGRRVVRALTGERSRFAPSEPRIVLAGELTPADAARLDPALVLGIATAHGTATAHAAILARALGLAAVVGLGETLLAIEDGTDVLLDGEAGTVQVAPPAAVVAEAEVRRTRLQQRRAAARARAHQPGATRDGTRIEVFANLGAVGEAAQAVQLGAEGVGLLRTEFLFLDRSELPGEEEQAQTLGEIAAALDGRPLIVRTLDAGADKPLPALPMPTEANPFLGVRGVRLGLQRPAVLETQLRAILRVAADHPVKAMLPMVATAQEIRAARTLLQRARAQTNIDAPLELGIMVEVPAAALTAAKLAQHADFFSLGTNDLTQYTMAAERGDERLAALLAGPQPAVLRLVRKTVQGAAAGGRWVGVCGELAGDPLAAVLFVGLGVTELSMAPALVPDCKAALREVDLASAQTAAAAALQADDLDGVRALAAELL